MPATKPVLSSSSADKRQTDIPSSTANDSSRTPDSCPSPTRPTGESGATASCPPNASTTLSPSNHHLPNPAVGGRTNSMKGTTISAPGGGGGRGMASAEVLTSASSTSPFLSFTYPTNCSRPTVEDAQYLQSHGIPALVDQLYNNVLCARPEEPVSYIIEQLKETASTTTNGATVESGEETSAGNRCGPSSGRRSNMSSPSTGSMNPPNTNGSLASARRLTNPQRILQQSRGSSPQNAPGKGFRRSNRLYRTPPVTPPRSTVDGVLEGSSLGHGLSIPQAPPNNFTFGASTQPSGSSTLGVRHASLTANQAEDNTTSPSLPQHVGGVRISSYASFTAQGAQPPSAAIFSSDARPMHSSNPQPKGSLTGTVSLSCSADGVTPLLYTPAFNMRASLSSVLEREDVSPSDASMFSVNSVDIQEFLQDFRIAKEEYLGSEEHQMTLEQLSVILEHVNFPVPDITIFADLFYELLETRRKSICSLSHPIGAKSSFHDDTMTSSSTTSSAKMTNLCSCTQPPGQLERSATLDATCFSGPPNPECVTPAAAVTSAADVHDEKVNCETFLARMAFKILGHYPNDIIRQVFFRMVGEEGGLSPVPGASLSQCFGDHPVPDPHSRLEKSLDPDPNTVAPMPQSPPLHALAPTPMVGGSFPPPIRVVHGSVDSGAGNPDHRSTRGHPTATPAPVDGSGSHFPTTSSVDDVSALSSANLFRRRSATAYPCRAPNTASLPTAGQAPGMSALPRASRSELSITTTESPFVMDETPLTTPFTTFSGAPGTPFSHFIQTVPLRQCLNDGIRGKLGLGHLTEAELGMAVRLAGIPDGNAALECHINDFVRLVRRVERLVHRGYGANVTMGSAVLSTNSVLASLKESHLHLFGTWKSEHPSQSPI